AKGGRQKEDRCPPCQCDAGEFRRRRQEKQPGSGDRKIGRVPRSIPAWGDGPGIRDRAPRAQARTDLARNTDTVRVPHHSPPNLRTNQGTAAPGIEGKECLCRRKYLSCQTGAERKN